MLGNLPEHLDPELQVVTDYWLRLKDEHGRVPRLREIDLMSIYGAARNIFIADRIEGLDGETLYRWRYWGTGVRDHTGIEATGKYLHETHNEAGVRDAINSYDAVLETLEPDYWVKRTRTIPVDRTYLSYRRIVFPLLNDEDRPAHVFGVFVSEQREVPVMQSGSPMQQGGIIEFIDDDPRP